jgi:hypothetical protein
MYFINGTPEAEVAAIIETVDSGSDILDELTRVALTCAALYEDSAVLRYAGALGPVLGVDIGRVLDALERPRAPE